MFNTVPYNSFPASSELLRKLNDLNEQKANQITIAQFFNSESSYDVGDLVYYNGLSYRCTNAHEGAWDADDFAPTTIANELATLRSGLIGANYILNDSVKGGDYITRLRGNVTKISNVVTITGVWQGSATNITIITLIPEGYRPSGDVAVTGSGTVDISGTLSYAEYTILPNGQLRQAQVAGAVSGGTFTFCYAI